MDFSDYSRHQHAESSRYINSDAPGEHIKNLTRYAGGDNENISIPTERQARDFESYGADQRQEVTCRVQPERERLQRPRWNDLATTAVSSLSEFICAPCFVNTSTSMDHESPAYLTTTTLPTNNRGMGDGATSGNNDMLVSSIHSTSVPLISFPSVHLDSSVWIDPEDEDDSAYFQTPSSRFSMNFLQGLSSSPPQKPQPSIYRTPSALAAANSLRSPASMSAGQWPAVPSDNPFGLHRSPAWSDDHNDDEDDILSLADDDGDDWETLVPVHNPDYRHIQTDSVIDVTGMEDMFNDFEVSVDANQHVSRDP
jgi:hypothetical protein